jgi:hypothetical protein
VWVIAGEVEPGLSVPETVRVLDLTASFGAQPARRNTGDCLSEAARRIVQRVASG